MTSSTARTTAVSTIASAARRCAATQGAAARSCSPRTRHSVEWGQVFSDEVLATAILDRLVHHCDVISINGPSFRLKDRIVTSPTPTSVPSSTCRTPTSEVVRRHLRLPPLLYGLPYQASPIAGTGYRQPTAADMEVITVFM